MKIVTTRHRLSLLSDPSKPPSEITEISPAPPMPFQVCLPTLPTQACLDIHRSQRVDPRWRHRSPITNFSLVERSMDAFDTMEQDEPRVRSKSSHSLTRCPSEMAENIVPDPDEGDLDDLDDMLDQFSGTNVDHISSASPIREVEREQQRDCPADTTEQFSKQMQDDMMTLMESISKMPEAHRDIDAMFQEVSQELGRIKTQDADTKANSNSQRPIGGSRSARPKDIAFHDSIRKTMERMQASGVATTTGLDFETSEELLTHLMTSMEDGEAGEPVDQQGLQSMLLGMMEELTNKEILYEPMKELKEKYPGWIDSHKSSLSAADLERYQKQYHLVDEIVQRFERDGYTDMNISDRDFIVQRMQKMQGAGNPPEDLVGDMKATQDTFDQADTGCNQQ